MGPGLGRSASQTGASTPGSSLRTPLGAIGMSGQDGTLAAGSGSFRSNWQAVLASLDGSTGGQGSEPSTGSETADQDSSFLAAGLVGQKWGMAGIGVAGKGSAAAGASNPNPLPNASAAAASAASLEKIARIQQLAALKSALSSSVASATESASSGLASRTNSSPSSHSAHGSGVSDSSNPAVAFPDSLPASLLPIAQLAGNSAQADRAQGHTNNSASALTGTGPRESAPLTESPFPTRALAIPGATGLSTPPAVPEAQASAIGEPSGSRPNTAVDGADTLSLAIPDLPVAGAGSPGASLDGLNSMSVAGGAMESASAAVSGDALSPAEFAAERRGLTGPSNASDLSGSPAQRSQRGSSSDIAKGIAAVGPEFAAVNQASSTSGSTASPFGALGSSPGPALGVASGSGSGSFGSATAPSAGETFAALDGDAPVGSIGWTHAGAHRAEAGFEDPALGWVGVRADLAGGGVHASLVSGSNEAAAMLGSHLAGLNEYLAERHPTLANVTLAVPEKSGLSTSAQPDSGTQSGSQSSAHQDSSSNSGSSNGGFSNSSATDASNNWTSARSNQNSGAGEGIARALPSNTSIPAMHSAAEAMSRSKGNHISLMA